MWKHIVGMSLLAVAFHFLLRSVEQASLLSIPARVQSPLQWHLKGADHVQNDSSGVPFVTIHDILPEDLLNAVVSEIESSIRVRQQVGGGNDLDCTLRRDGLSCGHERWIDFTLNDAQDREQRTKGKSSTPKDIFEQAVIQTAQINMLQVLPEYIASHVAGVSWRLLVSISGDNPNIFHYDSDEDTDYAITDSPLIYPLLSTVTYLNGIGEPTLILEQTQSSMRNSKNDTTINLPSAAYVSMPHPNKHIAFDPRLFHGSSAPISKHKGKIRLGIGTNFHTRKSLESTIRDDEGDVLNSFALVPPLDLNTLNTKHETQPSLHPWNKKNNLQISKTKNHRHTWENFDLLTYLDGYDFCGPIHSPCTLSMRLPIQQILKFDEEKESGCTLGFELNTVATTSFDNMDFKVIKHSDTTVSGGLMQNTFPKAKEIAKEMLQLRCSIYNHDENSMNPPTLAC